MRIITTVKFSIALALSGSILCACTSAPINTATEEKIFFDQRTSLINKHSKNDNTFAALQAQVDEKNPESADYWRWRIDQYLYGQYSEYQPIYNAFAKGKTFHQIYDLPAENLGPKTPLPNKLPELPKGYFTENLEGNPHIGSHVVIGNKVYIVYQGHLTDPYVASYDLNSREWKGPYKAAESTLSKGDRKIDSHGRPIIEMDTKGHIHIIYGGHGGEREDGLNPLSIDTPHAGGRMLHVMSEKPYDIRKFVQVNDISPFASYTASEKMANGDIYFFTRMGTHKSPWVFYKMKSGEQQFESPVVITWPTPQHDDPIKVDTFYITPLRVSDTEIAISSLWHECNFHEIHDKESYGRINSYYMKLDTTTDTFYNAQQQKLTLPITVATANQHTLAFDSTKREEVPFGTRPIIRKDNAPAVAYEALTKTLREWRMVSFENGAWKHSQPLPGTLERTLIDKANNNVNKIIDFQVLKTKENDSTALVIFRNTQGDAVFANATRTNNSSQDWQVSQEHLTITQANIAMAPIKNNLGKTVAVVVNIRKGAAQRLYLWHEGMFRAFD